MDFAFPSSPSAGDVTADGLWVYDAVGGWRRLRTAAPPDTGTVFPASAASGQRFYRTDLHMACFYDGTQWLSEQEHTISSMQQDVQAGSGSSGTAYGRFALRADYGLQFTRLLLATYVLTTNSSLAYWNCTLSTSLGATNTARATVTTQGDTPSSYVNHDTALTFALAAGAATHAILVCSKTSAPGALYPAAALCYRLIVT